ncbi:Phosphatidylinositol kinase (PIK-I) [Phytophthora cinnamomi]|uniref:Phosphatidylinositol kinase (PIK-I) n=1 Tax=Phytophthora cinnamomi TaxID=4785 RepID=UPI003559AE38|nr:Phosphatidylinositol kinase (PIK-I) [Phytophthora cinnamomi]
MGATRCEGLVRIRERVAFQASSGVKEDAARSFSSSSSSSSGRRSASRLSDDVWYFCVCRASAAALEWFTVDAGTESSDEEDAAAPSSSSGGAVLLASTRVSSVEAVDGENVKLPDEGDDAEDADAFGCLRLDDAERKRLERCSFYVEDDESGIALLIETESQEQRDQWVQFLSGQLSRGEEEPDGEQEQVEQEVEESDEAQEAGEDVVEDLESLHFAASRSSISVRSLLHQGKSENLMEEEDPFGLLSLTTSALSSMAPVDSLGSPVKGTTGSAAPGMFAMDHFELAEGNGHAEEIEDTEDGDVSVANTDFETAADTVVDPSLLLSSGRQQSERLRERSTSNVTDPLSSSVIRESSEINDSADLSIHPSL